jgi:hypothetical protein
MFCKDLAIRNYEHQRRPNVVSPRWRSPLAQVYGDDAAPPNRLFCGRRSHDGADAIPTHQPFDPAAAGATSLRPQGGMNPTAITLTGVAMDLPDHGKERRNWR